MYIGIYYVCDIFVCFNKVTVMGNILFSVQLRLVGFSTYKFIIEKYKSMIY